MDLQPYLPQLTNCFQQHQVVLAYLFGSQATGQTWSRSDVDVALLLESGLTTEQIARTHLALTNALMDIFERNDVDVLILNRAKPLLAQQVVKLGEQIYGPDDQIRIDFEVETLRRYIDTRPLRQLQQAYLENRVRQRQGKPAKPLPVGSKR